MARGRGTTGARATSSRRENGAGGHPTLGQWQHRMAEVYAKGPAADEPSVGSGPNVEVIMPMAMEDIDAFDERYEMIYPEDDTPIAHDLTWAYGVMRHSDSADLYVIGRVVSLRGGVGVMHSAAFPVRRVPDRDISHEDASRQVSWDMINRIRHQRGPGAGAVVTDFIELTPGVSVYRHEDMPRTVNPLRSDAAAADVIGLPHCDHAAAFWSPDGEFQVLACPTCGAGALARVGQGDDAARREAEDALRGDRPSDLSGTLFS